MTTAAAALAAGQLFAADGAVSREEFDAMKEKVASLERAASEGVVAESELKWYDHFELAVGATGVLQGSSGADELSEKPRLRPLSSATLLRPLYATTGSAAKWRKLSRAWSTGFSVAGSAFGRDDDAIGLA